MPKAKARFPHETAIYQPPPGFAESWLSSLEATGPENIRARLAAKAHVGPAGSVYISTQDITIGFVEAWLAWHDAEKAAEDKAYRDRQSAILLWTAVAAAASAVGSLGAAIVTFIVAK